MECSHLCMLIGSSREQMGFLLAEQVAPFLAPTPHLHLAELHFGNHSDSGEELCLSLLDAHSFALLRETRFEAASVLTLEYSPMGAHLVVALVDYNHGDVCYHDWCNIRLFDADTLRCLCEAYIEGATDIAYNLSGDLIAVGCDSGVIHLISANTLEMKRELDATYAPLDEDEWLSVKKLRFSHSETCLAFTAVSRKGASLRFVDAMSLSWNIEFLSWTHHNNQVHFVDVKFDPNGKHICVGFDEHLQLLNSNSLAPICESDRQFLGSGSCIIEGFTYHPDGECILVGCSDMDDGDILCYLLEPSTLTVLSQTRFRGLGLPTSLHNISYDSVGEWFVVECSGAVDDESQLLVVNSDLIEIKRATFFRMCQISFRPACRFDSRAYRLFYGERI